MNSNEHRYRPLPILIAAKRTASEMRSGLAIAYRTSSLPEKIATFKKMDAVEAARYAWIGGAMLILLNFAAVFSPMFISRASTVAADQAGPSTVAFVSQLKQAGLSASVLTGAKRAGLSGKGETITLGGDSLQAFEYISPITAEQEAKDFIQSYHNAPQSAMDQPLSLYVQGGLLVIYLGNRQNVLQALDNTLGAPLIGGMALVRPAAPQAGT